MMLSFSKLFEAQYASSIESDIIKIIEQKAVVRISYANKPGFREIEIHDLGVNKNNDLVISAYQTRGPSETESMGWKYFFVNRIENMQITKKTFNRPRPNWNPEDTTHMFVRKIASAQF